MKIRSRKNKVEADLQDEEVYVGGEPDTLIPFDWIQYQQDINPENDDDEIFKKELW